MADFISIPLLDQPGLSRRFEDPQAWAEQLNTFIPGNICELKSHQGVFSHRTAMLPLGSLRILSTLGSSIQLESRGSGLVQLVMPYRGVTSWQVDRQWFESAAPESVLYVPHGPLQIESTLTAGIVTFVEPDALLKTALSMVGADFAAAHIRSALASPRLIAVDCEPYRQLAHILYSFYENLDSLVSAGGEILRRSCIDDQILRLWVLLLIPELHVAPPDLGAGSRFDAASVWVKELADWIAVHADRPLSLTDLEQQSGYSRRSLQAAFRVVLGCTPMQWVKRCRLQKVRKSLERPEPGDSVGSAARRAGFSNAAAFTRDFVQLYGEKPSAVLRQARRSSVLAS